MPSDESLDGTERGTCDECGRNNVKTISCEDARYGDEIDVCSRCIGNEPELNPTQADGDDRYNDTGTDQNDPDPDARGDSR